MHNVFPQSLCLPVMLEKSTGVQNDLRGATTHTNQHLCTFNSFINAAPRGGGSCVCAWCVCARERVSV